MNYTPLPTKPAVQLRFVGNVILVAITMIVVALRIVARLVTGSKLGWDDYLIIVASPQVVAMLTCQGFCKLHILRTAARDDE